MLDVVGGDESGDAVVGRDAAAEEEDANARDEGKHITVRGVTVWVRRVCADVHVRMFFFVCMYIWMYV